MLIHNSRATRKGYPESLRAILNVESADESRAWLDAWPLMPPGATPCWPLPDQAEQLGVAALFVKDESRRSKLASFKALGAPIALVRLVMRENLDAGYTAESLLNGEHAASLGAFTVISATDGNHGRALAAAARSIGCRCVIVIHRHVSEERHRAIEAFGAEVVRIDGGYDDSVREAARLADQCGWHVVSDTSYDGYETIPRDVMQGYGAIAGESIRASTGATGDGSPYTHVFIQGGVGGLAAGVISYMSETFGALRPIFVIVEPEQADCLYQSARQGMAARASGSVDSIMAGLACGETSPLAWRFLDSLADFFMTVLDADAIDAMRVLARGSTRDIPVVSGESGAAGLAGVYKVAQNTAWRALVKLDANSRVLVINTEGATAPELYAELVGRCAEAVLDAQERWLERSSFNPRRSLIRTSSAKFDTASIWQARIDLAACFRMAARLGMHEGICNHLSALVPGHDDLFLVNPFGYAFEEISASQLLICDFNGRVLDGDGVPEITAFHIHARIHASQSRIRAAFHTHMPNATALAMLQGAPLQWAGQTALKFFGRTVVDECYNGLALDTTEGDRIAGAIGSADIVFLRNHGVMVLGSTIAQAWDDLYYLERACEAQRLALSTGRPLLAVDPDMAVKVARQMASDNGDSARKHLESIKRILDFHEPDYAG